MVKAYSLKLYQGAAKAIKDSPIPEHDAETLSWRRCRGWTTEEAAEKPAKTKITFVGQLSPKKRRKIVLLDLWVEVEISLEGKTIKTMESES